MTPVLVLAARPDPASPRHPELEPQERDRCGRFRHDRDAARHATGRLLARAALRHLLGVPTPLSFHPGGQPYSRHPPGHVSISHSGDVVLAAAAAIPLGIDVERRDTIAPLLHDPGARESTFHPDELNELSRSDDPEAQASRWWTAKEAGLKAVGLGLQIDPSTVDAHRCPLVIPGHGAWSVTDLTEHIAAPHHYASLATPTGRHITLHVRTSYDIWS